MLHETNVTRLESTLHRLTRVDLQCHMNRQTLVERDQGRKWGKWNGLTWTKETEVEFIRGFCEWIEQNREDVKSVFCDGVPLWTRDKS